MRRLAPARDARFASQLRRDRNDSRAPRERAPCECDRPAVDAIVPVGWVGLSEASLLQTCDAVVADAIARGLDPSRLHPDRLIARLAAQQDALITRDQLRALELTRGQIGSRVARGLLRALHDGVYRWGAPLQTPSMRARAAALACGDHALVRGRSSLALWGVLAPTAAPIEVLVVGRRVRHRRITTHETASLDIADARDLRGIPLTAPARALVEVAADLRPPDLADAVERAQVRRLVTKAQIVAAVQRAPRSRGVRSLRALVERPGFTRSRAERILVGLLNRAGLPRPLLNTDVDGYEVDALWRVERVIVEFDSYGFHATRAAFERDRARDAAHLRSGHLTLRTTWYELTEQPFALVARLAEALGARR
jgi:very-short-patch-repair endonuclease